ncbi:MAG: hypothetical protein MJ252_09340 [archaeon]|nr:hypothetical protein [archaeon]
MWKKPNIDLAIKYFEKALSLDDKNKTSLRSLSMIIRTKESKTTEEKSQIAQQSLDYAKKAIKLDMQDSNSWYVYGNAYFYKAFIDKTQYNDLNMALSAYNKSQEKNTKYKNPDLYYNRGVVHAYLENYEQAYTDFMEANAIDQNLKSNEICQSILTTVGTINKMIKNQCGLKPKNLAQIVTSVPTRLRDDVHYDLINIRNLVEGENKGKLITGKIIQAAASCFEVPICLVVLDYEGEFCALSLYNISKEILSTIKFKASSFIVLNPVVKMIKMEDKKEGKTYEYKCIQVNDLLSFLVDGKYCAEYASSATLNSTFFN